MVADLEAVRRLGLDAGLPTYSVHNQPWRQAVMPLLNGDTSEVFEEVIDVRVVRMKGHEFLKCFLHYLPPKRGE